MSLRRVFPWVLFWLCAVSATFWWILSDTERTTRKYLESAEIRWAKEDYLGAIRDYERIIEEYPRSPMVSEANYWRGVAFFLYLDNNEKAIASFNESIRTAVSSLDKNHALKAHLYIAEIYEKKLNQPKKAITVYEKVMEITSDLDQVLEVQYKVGSLYFDLGDMEQARVEWDLLAKKDPRNKWAPAALYRGGGTYFILGMCDEAIEIYKTLYTEYPEHETSPFAKFRAANCLEENKAQAEALQLYKELEGVYPNEEILTGKIKKLKRLTRGS
ncbi:MAG: tol-pal system YbgF family protein [Nitrospiria bacterium]